MKRQLSSVILVAAVVSSGACQSTAPAVDFFSSATPAASDYEEILANHTRRAHVYDFLEDKVNVKATYHSASFKKAFVAARDGFHGRAADHMERMLLGQPHPTDPIQDFAKVVEPFAESAPTSPDLKGSETFFVAIYVSEQSHRSLIHDSSIWDVTLSVDGGADIEPLRIERIRRTPSLDQVYPFLNKLDMPYVLYFPATLANGKPLIPKSVKNMRLRIVSKLADAKLNWQTK